MALELCDYIFIARQKLNDVLGAYSNFFIKNNFDESDVNNPLVKAKKALIEIDNVKLYNCKNNEDVDNIIAQIKEYEVLLQKNTDNK